MICLSAIFTELIMLIMILVSVAFVTLLERSILGYIHLRKGPNKLFLVGVFQPLADAGKLFVSEMIMFFGTVYFLYFFGPLMGLLIFFFSWMVFPNVWGGLDFVLGLVYFFCMSSLGVYALFWCGWSSKSLYGLIGAIRGVAQMVSYEVSLIFIVVSCVILSVSYDFIVISLNQEIIWFFFFFPSLLMMWVVSCLAETNRAPFDFAEGESELVSGFNVEYGGVGFAFIFMAEYGMIVLMSCLVVVLFFGGLMMVSFLGVVIVVFWIWVRGSYPRFRYDKLMKMAWCSYLPISLNYFSLSFGLIFMMMLIL